MKHSACLVIPGTQADAVVAKHQAPAFPIMIFRAIPDKGSTASLTKKQQDA
jgi:hypothetical protein